MATQQREGMLYLFLSVVGYSMFPIFAEWILASGMDAIDLAPIRFTLALPVIGIYLLVRGQSSEAQPPRRLALMLCGPLMAISALCAFLALDLIQPSLLILIFYSYPAIVALIGWVRGERLGGLAWLALGLTMIGIVLTLPNLGGDMFAGADMRGVMFAALNALFVALYMITTGGAMGRYKDAPRATAWVLLGAWIPLLIMGLVRGFALPSEPKIWLLFVGMVIFSTVMPIVTLNAGIQRLGASRAALFCTFEPVLTILLSVLILDDSLLPLQMVGSVLIIGSVILLQVRPAVQPPPFEVSPSKNP